MYYLLASIIVSAFIGGGAYMTTHTHHTQPPVSNQAKVESSVEASSTASTESSNFVDLSL